MPPNVYCYWDSSEHADENQGMMLRVWARSWASRGWRPRILTVRNAERHPEFNRLSPDNPQYLFELSRMAAQASRVKWVCPVEIINFSFTPHYRRIHGMFGYGYKLFGATGWLDAPLVRFENIHDVSVIEECGRPL